MGRIGYLIIAIALIVALLATFVITFVLYRKTPVPEGCESLGVGKKECGACNQVGCPLRKEEK